MINNQVLLPEHNIYINLLLHVYLIVNIYIQY